MQAAYYHIDNVPSNKVSRLGIHLITFISSFILFFKLSTLKTGIITRLNKVINKKLAKAYFQSEGLLKLINEKDIIDHFEESKEAHKIIEKTLSHFREVYTTLEQTNFLHNTETKELCDNFLTNLYKIEGKFRAVVFANSGVPEDKKLTKIAAQLSLS